MKIYFDTLGCPKNFNDSEHACGLLESAGNIIVNEIEDILKIIQSGREESEKE